MPDLEADLYNLTMSEEAQPLLDAVTKHITDNVDPILEEYQTLQAEKDDPWQWHPRQLELLDGAKNKAKESGLWNFFLPDADTGEGRETGVFIRLVALPGLEQPDGAGLDQVFDLHTVGQALMQTPGYALDELQVLVDDHANILYRAPVM